MRLDKLTQAYQQKEPEPDFSVLTDQELDYYIETLAKAGYDDVNGHAIKGNLSVLTDGELQRIETINQKAMEAGSYAN